MERPDGLLEVGRIGRAHGVRGDVFVELTSDRTERVEVGARLWVRDGWRTVESSQRSGARWRVHLSGTDDRTAAEALARTLLYAEPLDDPDTLWVHQLIGAVVVDGEGVARGHCVSVIDNPAADLLELESGALVPANFVVGVDTDADPVVVTVEAPDGLFELFVAET